MLREKGVGVEAEGEEPKQVSEEKKQQKICEVLTIIVLGLLSCIGPYLQQRNACTYL
jgi:hypothetical protein